MQRAFLFLSGTTGNGGFRGISRAKAGVCRIGKKAQSAAAAMIEFVFAHFAAKGIAVHA
jgi:hypothetical protein